jgi:hypothetical protein
MKNRFKIREFLLQGANSAWRCRKIGFLLFTVEFFMAFIPVSALHAGWNRLLGHSLAGDAVLRGFGADFFAEFSAHHPDAVSSGLMTLMLLSGVSLVLGLFFSGGMIACFLNARGIGFPLFFQNSSRFFGRFLRLFLISLPLLSVVFAGWLLFNRSLLPAAGGSEPLGVAITLSGIAAAAVAVLLIDMVLDYAKIITVRRDRHDMLLTAFQAFRFVLAHPGKTMGLYASIGAAGLAGSLLFAGICRVADFPSAAGLFLLFLCQQAGAVFRTAIRMEFFSAQTALVKAIPQRKKRKV